MGRRRDAPRTADVDSSALAGLGGSDEEPRSGAFVLDARRLPPAHLLVADLVVVHVVDAPNLPKLLIRLPFDPTENDVDQERLSFEGLVDGGVLLAVVADHRGPSVEAGVLKEVVGIADGRVVHDGEKAAFLEGLQTDCVATRTVAIEEGAG